MATAPANNYAEQPRAPANNGAGYVLLDAGHGGADPGSIGAGVIEKDAALEIVLMTASLLDEAGVDYILTRSADDTVSAEQRIQAAEGKEAAFVISVHCDWYKNKDVRGTSTQYIAGDDESKALAKLLHGHLLNDLGAEDRGIQPRGGMQLLRKSKAPAVLAELAFLSNDLDTALLNSESFKAQAAKNLAAGICAALVTPATVTIHGD